MDETVRILIVEDEKVVRDIFQRLLSPLGYCLKFIERGDHAIQALSRHSDYHLVITDLMLPGFSGQQILEHVRQLDPSLPVIMITAYASVDSALEAMKAGAFDYITKPFNNDEVMLIINKAIEKRRLVEENLKLRRALDRKYGFENIIGRSQAMMEVFEIIRQAAPSTATILIRGESGTGKELIARAIHHNSPRRSQPFVTLNAGAIPADLLESQLFGHVKGAFTGAINDKKGLFEIANKGSLFLDEIGNISMDLQAKLLRVLQEKEITPVGSTAVSRIDVRLICATNADLEQMIEDGVFRKDFYYRLNVIDVALPPLRERMEDLPLLTDHFIRKYERINRKDISGVEPEFMVALESYDWPGNVRELENVIERAVVLSQDNAITPRLLPPSLQAGSRQRSLNARALDFSVPMPKQVQDFEKSLIRHALEQTQGVQKDAATLLGIKPTTLNEMLKRHGLR